MLRHTKRIESAYAGFQEVNSDPELLDIASEEPFIHWWTTQLHQKVLKKTGLWPRFAQGFLQKSADALPGPGMLI